MPVETGASNLLLCAIGFGRFTQLIGAGKGIMALDDGNTGAGRQTTAIFSQLCGSGTFLKLPQIHRRQRQAQASIANKGDIITTEDDGPERKIVVVVLPILYQIDLDQQFLVWLVNDGRTASFIDLSLEAVEYRIESLLCGLCQVEREMPQGQHKIAVLLFLSMLIADLLNALAHAIAICMHNGNMAVFARCCSHIIEIGGVTISFG